MSRRSRNSRAWRYVWGGIRRDADARALEEWSYDRLEVSIQGLLFPTPPPGLKALSRFEASVDTGVSVLCHMMPLVYTPGRRSDVSP